MKTELTVKEAIEQGYTDFLYASDGWQSVKSIVSDEIDWAKSDIFLAQKEPEHPNAPDGDDIPDILAEYAANTYADET